MSETSSSASASSTGRPVTVEASATTRVQAPGLRHFAQVRKKFADYKPAGEALKGGAEALKGLSRHMLGERSAEQVDRPQPAPAPEGSQRKEKQPAVATASAEAQEFEELEQELESTSTGTEPVGGGEGTSGAVAARDDQASATKAKVVTPEALAGRLEQNGIHILPGGILDMSAIGSGFFHGKRDVQVRMWQDGTGQWHMNAEGSCSRANQILFDNLRDALGLPMSHVEVTDGAAVRDKGALFDAESLNRLMSPKEAEIFKLDSNAPIGNSMRVWWDGTLYEIPSRENPSVMGRVEYGPDGLGERLKSVPCKEVFPSLGEMKDDAAAEKVWQRSLDQDKILEELEDWLKGRGAEEKRKEEAEQARSAVALAGTPSREPTPLLRQPKPEPGTASQRGAVGRLEESAVVEGQASAMEIASHTSERAASSVATGEMAATASQVPGRSASESLPEHREAVLQAARKLVVSSGGRSSPFEALSTELGSGPAAHTVQQGGMTIHEIPAPDPNPFDTPLTAQEQEQMGRTEDTAGFAAVAKEASSSSSVSSRSTGTETGQE